MHIGVEFEGLVVSVEFSDDEPRPTDDTIIAAARAEMIEQIKDAPDGFFNIEDEENED